MEMQELQRIRSEHYREMGSIGGECESPDEIEVRHADVSMRLAARLIDECEQLIIERDAARAAGVEVVRTIRTARPLQGLWFGG